MAMPGTKRKPSLREVASQVLVTVKWKGLVGQVKGSSVGGGATSLKYDKSKDLSAMEEKRWYLSKLLENYPSHFNKRIEEVNKFTLLSHFGRERRNSVSF